ncbi:MAG: SlyX family protein [Pseudomonadales bacterium]|nr:SlyX family protein [Pseudomonadales bacterium]
MNEFENKLLDLESRYSFLDDLLQKLNDVVARQQLQLDDQQKLLQMMQERLLEVSERMDHGEGAQLDEKPPHY